MKSKRPTLKGFLKWCYDNDVPIRNSTKPEKKLEYYKKYREEMGI